MKYLALANDGEIYDLCDCGDFEAAVESAESININAVWIFDEETAWEYAARLLNILEDEEPGRVPF